MSTETLKLHGDSCGKWQVRIFYGCLSVRRVPMDWRVVCIVLLYEGKCDRQDCGKNRGISLRSWMENVCQGSDIDRVMESTEKGIGEDQCGVRKDRCS